MKWWYFFNDEEDDEKANEKNEEDSKKNESNDPRYKVLCYLNYIIEKSKSLVNLGENLTIDETMIFFRGRRIYLIINVKEMFTNIGKNYSFFG